MSRLVNSFKQNKNVVKKDTSIIDFAVGIVLIIIGIYTIMKNTSIGVLWMNRLFGFNLPSGVITIPILVGIAIVFFKHRSLIGWIIIAIGAIAMLIQIIMSLNITFNTTSLFDYFLMFGGVFGGLGLLAKAFLRN